MQRRRVPRRSPSEHLGGTFSGGPGRTSLCPNIPPRKAAVARPAWSRAGAGLRSLPGGPQRQEEGPLWTPLGFHDAGSGGGWKQCLDETPGGAG